MKTIPFIFGVLGMQKFLLSRLSRLLKGRREESGARKKNTVRVGDAFFTELGDHATESAE